MDKKIKMTKTVIDHIVLLKVRSDVTEEDMSRLEKGVSSLKAIPGVLSISLGQTFCEEWMDDRRNGYSHTITCRLESKDALRVYQDHELHTKMKSECFFPILDGLVTVVDFEVLVSDDNNSSE